MKKYNIIYADPAWEYGDVSDYRIMHGGVAKHYKTMKIEDIKKLPINNIADNDCILFLWVTFPILDKAFEVIKSWGFKYKTIGFTWIKLNKRNKKPFFGIGYWTKSNAEICLIATKGSPGKFKISNKVSSVILSLASSGFCECLLLSERITELLGDRPRIELFARNNSPGWDIWGNEVESSISL